MAKSKSKKSVKSRSSTTSVDASSIVEDELGNYRIKAGRLSGNFVARAFPRSTSSGKGLIAEVSGASEAEAIAALKELLTEREVQRTAIRRWEQRSEISVPSTEEFVEALQQVKLSEAQLSMLKSLALAGETGLTVVGLMNAAGYRSQSTASKIFARAGALFADFLGVELPATGGQDKEGAANVFSFREDVGRDAPPHWVMHNEMRDAVRATLRTALPLEQR